MPKVMSKVTSKEISKVVSKTTRFDAADYLDTEARQVAYIAAALESGDADFVRDALGVVARARGMGGIAKRAGLNRESLYKALGETGNPEFGTVMRIVRAMGLTLSARPAASGQTSKRRRVALSRGGKTHSHGKRSQDRARLSRA